LQRPGFTLHAAGAAEGAAAVQLRVSGRHQVGNALLAAAVGLAQGLPVAEVAAALGRAEARSHWRMELHERADGVLVVNDAYNANPDSMAAALRTLASLRRPDGRLAAVLGDMLELGPTAAAQHREIGALAAGLGVDRLVAIGAHAADLASGFGAGATTVADRDAAVGQVRSWAHPADVVLVKASRGLALESVAEQLSSDPEGRA
jgi:UDP-N-acetylmuramoyl-tripeptide--D-alanyl-D-alanine ligase